MIKDIPEYQGLYGATEDGKIWSHKSNKFLTPTLQKTGYYKVTLFKQNSPKKCIYVHKLIALTYIPKPESDKELTVDHIDRNKINNNVSNLRWATRSEQCQNRGWTDNMQAAVEKASKAIAHAVQQRDIHNHDVLLNTFESCSAAAFELFGDKSKNSLINRCAQGKRNSAYGYWWKFVD